MSDNRTIPALEKEIEALRDQLQKFQLLANHTADLLALSNEAAEFVYASPSYERELGYTDADLLGRPVTDKVHPDDLPRILEIIAQRYETLDPTPVSIEYRMKTRKGDYLWFETRGQILFDAAGMPAGAVYSSRNVTEHKQAVDALKRSEENYRTIMESVAHSITISDMETGRFFEVNDGFCKITGYSREEALRESVFSLKLMENPEERKHLIETLQRDGEVVGAAVQYRSKSGRMLDTVFSARSMEYAGRPCFIAVVQDVTDLRKVEKARAKLLRQLQEAQKLESLGTLAGGIAHDFNNLLMGIQGRTSLMTRELDVGHAFQEHLAGIEAYVESAANLTQQLLGFARGGKYEVKPIDFNDLIQKSADLFGRTRKEIRIHTDFGEALPDVEADRSQIEQILLNMYVNAWQAMPGGGDLRLETRCVSLDENDSRQHQALPGRYVKLAITDTGIGMDEKTRLRIFDPFFTTKEKERGTGLGLASAYGIIQNHGGFITVQSEPGQGTAFHIYLPASHRTAIHEPSRQQFLHAGSETILLVDDEALIIDVGQSMLEALGYTVVTATGGRAGLEALQRRGDVIDLVILDLIMPDMDGGKTFEKMQQIKPGVAVLLSSGYSRDGKAEEIMRNGAAGFIQKPFSMAALSEKVRSVLALSGCTQRTKALQ